MSDYAFVDTDAESLEATLIELYESETGHTLQPSDPERLFLAWVANALVQERVNLNYVGNQNIPSRAEGENLDALGEWIFGLSRHGAQAAKVTMRFTISAAQESSVLIPSGTRVTDSSQDLVWATTSDALIEIGETSVDVMAECETAGTIGNGYATGQINTLIDVDNILYFSSCANVTASDGGSEEQSDEDYYKAMREVLDSYSTAGAEGSYVFWAKSVSDEIADVKAVCPTLEREEVVDIVTSASGELRAYVGGERIQTSSIEVYDSDFKTVLRKGTEWTRNYSDGLLKIVIDADSTVATATSIGVKFTQVMAGYVYLYALMNDGSIASDTIKEAIYEACNDKYVRPLTDCVVVADPETVEYDIDFTYYISEDSELSASEIETGVTEAVNTYIEWQSAKLGRDINPDKLKTLLMNAGVKRCDITSPVFTHLNSGSDDDVPQVAVLGDTQIINGGYEDE